MEKDLLRFSQIMAALSEIYTPGKEASSVRVELYFQALEEYEISRIEKAVKQLIKTKEINCFPVPGEIIKHIKENSEAIPLYQCEYHNPYISEHEAELRESGLTDAEWRAKQKAEARKILNMLEKRGVKIV